MVVKDDETCMNEASHCVQTDMQDVKSLLLYPASSLSPSLLSATPTSGKTHTIDYTDLSQETLQAVYNITMGAWGQGKHEIKG